MFNAGGKFPIPYHILLTVQLTAAINDTSQHQHLKLMQVDHTKVRKCPKRKLTMGVFKGNLKTANKRIPLSKVVGHSVKPAWHSPNSTSAFHSTMDLELAAALQDINMLGQLESSWWVSLLRGVDIIVKDVSQQQWFLVLGEDANVGIGWLVTTTMHSSCAYEFIFLFLCVCVCVCVCCYCCCCCCFVWCSAPSETASREDGQ